MAKSHNRRTKQIRRLRKKHYHKQEGLCYYCKGPMIFIEEYPKNVPIIRNMITLEHLCVPVLGERKNNKKTVAACASCNQAQASKQQQELYPHRHRLRSFNFRNFPFASNYYGA